MPYDASVCPSCGGPAPVIIENSITKGNAAPSTVPLNEFRSVLFSLGVYPNRITTFDKRGGIAAMLLPKRTDIAIKNIAGMNKKGLFGGIQFTMNDGTVRKILLRAGMDLEKIRDIVAGLI